MRWVGSGQVVVAVPDWWTTGETRCLAPVEDTVYFDMAATADCDDAPAPAAVREVSALAVLDADSGYGEMVVREMAPIGEVNGREVVERENCEEWFDGVCRRLFAVPSEGVAFAVTIAKRAMATTKRFATRCASCRKLRQRFRWRLVTVGHRRGVPNPRSPTLW